MFVSNVSLLAYDKFEIPLRLAASLSRVHTHILGSSVECRGHVSLAYSNEFVDVDFVEDLRPLNGKLASDSIEPKKKIKTECELAELRTKGEKPKPGIPTTHTYLHRHTLKT